MVHQINSTDVRISITILTVIAQFLTSFRLIYRYRMRRFWWDDGMALFAMLCQLCLLVALWIRTDVPGVGPLDEPQHARMIAYWILSIVFTFVLWASRMSMLLSVIRLIPPMMPLNYVAYTTFVLFVLMWSALVIQKVYICAHDRSWESLPIPQCHLGKDVAILELCTDFVSDSLLIFLPIRLLWKVNFPSHQKKLLFIIFSANILITIVSVVHATYVLGASGLLEALTANIEAAIALIVANFAVVITFIYRKWIRPGEETDQTPPRGWTARTDTGIAFGPLSRLRNITSAAVGTGKTGVSTIHFGRTTETRTETKGHRGNGNSAQFSEFQSGASSGEVYDDVWLKDRGGQDEGPKFFVTRETIDDNNEVVVDVENGGGQAGSARTHGHPNS